MKSDQGGVTHADFVHAVPQGSGPTVVNWTSARSQLPIISMSFCGLTSNDESFKIFLVVTVQSQ